MKLATLFLTACILFGALFLTGLGLWQMKRLAWKETLIARVETNMKNEPLSVSQVEQMIDREEDIEYRPATATGHFLHDGEAHYFATHNSKPGYFVYTPLVQADGTVIMVNRGYVPMDGKDRATRKAGEIDGQVTIVGLARSAPTEKPNTFVPNNDLAKNVFYWKSITQMLGMGIDKMKTNSNRFFLDANDAPVAGGSPVGGVTLLRFTNSHLQYALTWFGLAGALVVVGGIFLRSRIRDAKL
ncbi:MAG: SURF1 family protein [Rhizobiaceae bacterium]